MTTRDIRPRDADTPSNAETGKENENKTDAVHKSIFDDYHFTAGLAHRNHA
jgi:hypothetical protein